MAGFAIFMTIITYACVGIVLATLMSVTLIVLAKKRLPKELQGRRAFLTTCGFAPFAGLLWLVAAFLIHVHISNRLAHQDCGFSGDPYVTLPNGYVLGSHNTYDGYVVAPGYTTDVPVTGPGYVRSLIDIELTNGSFIGSYHDFNNDTVHDFTFNTRDRSIQTSDAGIRLDFGSVQDRVHADPTSYWNLYKKYRHRWPAFVFLGLIALGESAIILSLRRFRNKMQHRAVRSMSQ